MGDFLSRISSQISAFFNNLTPTRKLALGTTFAVVLGAMVSLFMWAGEKTFVPLYSNLTTDDAANAMRVLSEKRIPFRTDPTGKNISVPPEAVDQLRLELATMGIPQSGSVGYEVFDHQGLGTTSFVQKMNEVRAHEGELMRTINTIKGVKRSRVHLAIPTKSTFIEDQKKPSASVVLDLLPGSMLNDKQIFGIAHIVANAIPGLDSADVVIIDGMGKILSKNQTDSLAQATATQLEYKNKVEEETEHRIEQMLARVVGDGKVVARVSADIDFSVVAETQTTYDQDGSAVRSVVKDVDTMDGVRPGPQGPAGATSNLPGQAPVAASVIKNNTNHNNEVTNYEVPQTVKRTTHPQGQIKHLSVAVVVDNKQVRTTAADGTTKTDSVNWSEDKLKEFDTIVAQAAGIDRKRGDTLEVKGMDFAREDFDEAQRIMAESERKSYIQNLILYAVIGLTIILFFMLVVRPFIKWMTENTTDSVDTYLPQTIEELEKINKNAALPGLEDAVPQIADRIDPEKVEGEMLKEKIITLVENNPHKAALILRDWLHTQSAVKKDEKGSGTGGGKSKGA